MDGSSYRGEAGLGRNLISIPLNLYTTRYLTRVRKKVWPGRRPGYLGLAAAADCQVLLLLWHRRDRPRRNWLLIKQRPLSDIQRIFEEY
jgi:hypothetical protein